MLDTIVALATPPMKSALALIRVSGQDSFDIVSKIFSKDIRAIEKRTLLVGSIIDEGRVIDEVVLAVYKGPKSFTGEDLVEIICHGGMLIVNQIIDLLLSKGARMATNGEYSSRAFYNSKIDLVQAEAINDVINSISLEGKEISLLSLEGKTSELVKEIKTKIADILSLIEVNIDYPEYEDIEVANKEMVVNAVNEIVNKTSILIEDGEKAKVITEGIKTAIVGKPNVGKSSLLNALVGENKAIVTPIAGTTRDVVEGTINLNGIILRLFDTAGIHDSTNEIETIGVQKSIDTIKEADLILVILDSSSLLDDEDKQILELTKGLNRLIIYNKSDIKKSDDKDDICISAKNNDLSNLKEAIFNKYGINEETFKKPALTNARQIGLLRKIVNDLKDAKRDAENDLSVDLIAVSLMNAYKASQELLGENVDSDFTKEIFSRFCVGK